MATEFIIDSDPKQDIFEVKKIFEILPRKPRRARMSFKGCYTKLNRWEQSREPMSHCSYLESTKITGIADDNNPESTICLPNQKQKSSWNLESEPPTSPALLELNDEESLRESSYHDNNNDT